MGKSGIKYFYDVGDIINYTDKKLLVVDINEAFIPVYKLLNLKTGYVHTWFVSDIDSNSKLIS